MKLTRGEVQELLLAFIHFLVEVLGRQVHGDMYALAYEATEHWIVPLVLAKRADLQRQYYSQLPELWFDMMHPIHNDQEPVTTHRDFPGMSLLLPILKVLRQALCITDVHRLNMAVWEKMKLIRGVPILQNFGQPSIKRDDETQEQFEQRRSATRGIWTPPAELVGIPASAISIARSQITDIQAYTEFVTYGQQKGESDENFKSRMFTF
ncbi:MAG: hypothetical protein GY820_17125, partial [Gammaproteobacteria bacterium]|nr:hypothetical protein [Gammaproteobacteria bacterium]